jgi:hypothetical protein
MIVNKKIKQPPQLPTKSHNWTGARLGRRPLRASGAGKRLECPTCRKACAVKGGRAAELPLVYGMQGP